jgi:hypothetical protein
MSPEQKRPSRPKAEIDKFNRYVKIAPAAEEVCGVVNINCVITRVFPGLRDARFSKEVIYEKSGSDYSQREISGWV